MPLKFFSHRWLENVPVCTRAMEILSNVKAYVKAVNKKTVPRPSNKSYEVVATALQDKLLSSKLHVFKCIAGHLQPFLSFYQTDRPMLCFSSQDLSVMVRALMRRLIQNDKITPDISDYKLAGISSVHASNLTYKKVDVGFLIEKHLKEASKAGVSDRQLMEFRLECKDFISAVVKKVLFKCPIVYSL